jgi:hypothetical protein
LKLECCEINFKPEHVLFMIDGAFGNLLML